MDFSVRPERLKNHLHTAARQTVISEGCVEDWIMSQSLIRLIESKTFREVPLKFEIGDTVDVHSRILEGDKERIQIFQGVVIARRGTGMRESFIVRRIVAGEGVERTFPFHSPKIAKVEVIRHGIVRRAKLFYLRDRIGKATRLVERRPTKKPAGK
jgi:large subunit ribosomal protein L19